MSKTALEDVLSRVERKISSAREGIYNKMTHKYRVSSNSVLSEIYQEIISNPAYKKIPKDIFKDSVEKYCISLHKSFSSYRSSDKSSSYRVDILGNRTDFMVIIRQGSNKVNPTDIFNQFIKVRRTPALLELKKNVIKDISNWYIQQGKRAPNRDKLLDITMGYKDKTGKRTGGLLELGHVVGSSVIEQELYEPNIDFTRIVNRLPITQRSVTEKVLAEVGFELTTNPKQHGRLRNGSIVVSIYDQGVKSNNKQSDTEGAIRRQFSKAIKEVIKTVDFTTLRGSPSAIDIVEGKLHKAAKKAGFKEGVDNNKIASVSKTHKSKASKKIKVKEQEITSKESLSGTSVKAPRSKRVKNNNWLSLIPIINSKLSASVISNMQYPRLVNRTGRFANSVKITGVETTPQGYPSFVYTYMRDPYDVFDPVLGASPWSTPQRDPKTLIELSIREVAKGMAIERFYVRRGV